MSRVSIQVRVPFSDVDSSGRIHFIAMFRYMDIAEHELVRSIGFPRATTLLELAFPRVHASCDYLGPVGYDDQLTVEARVEHVGRSSWTVAFTARILQSASALRQTPQEDDAIVARGRMTMVVMDPATERASPLPEAFRVALLAADDR